MATESGAENAKKPNIFVRIGRWFKLAALELKKTTWPKPNEVIRKLGIVLVVVAFFFIVLMGMDLLLQHAFYNPLISGLPEPPVTPTPDTTGRALGFFNDIKSGF